MPLAGCGISSGITIDCADLRKPGGYYRIVWVLNKEDFRVPIDVTIADYVTSLELNTYRGLYKFESVKNSHEAVWTQQTGEGGNVSYLFTVTLRLPNSDPASDKVIEDASVSELVVITKSNGNEVQIWGAENGLSSGDGTTGGNGRQGTDSTFTTLVLTGDGTYLPKRLLINGTVPNTIVALDAMSV